MLQFHYFSGANTPLGFVSRFGDILPEHRAKRVVYIKGGPGTGKSTLMRSVARRFEELGERVEYFHCSSDPESLDAVALPDRGIALMDGTAPHTLDPKYPGAVGEWLDLSDCWDTDPLREHAGEVIGLSREISGTFSAAYACLKGAAALQQEQQERIVRISHNRAAQDAARLVYETLSGYAPAEYRGRERRPFLTGLTPLGKYGFAQGMALACEKRAVLRGWAPFTAEILTRVAAAARDRGFDVELFCCPMDPTGKPEHLYIPRLKLFITTANEHHRVDTTYDFSVDTFSYARPAELKSQQETLQRLDELFTAQLNAALAFLARAKELHDALEALYIPTMDFKKAQEKEAALFERLKGL